MSCCIYIISPFTCGQPPRGALRQRRQIAARCKLLGENHKAHSGSYSRDGRNPKIAGSQSKPLPTRTRICPISSSVSEPVRMFTMGFVHRICRGGAQRAGRCWTLKISTGGGLIFRIIGPLVCTLLACRTAGERYVGKMASLRGNHAHEDHDMNQMRVRESVKRSPLLIREAWAAEGQAQVSHLNLVVAEPWEHISEGQITVHHGTIALLFASLIRSGLVGSGRVWSRSQRSASGTDDRRCWNKVWWT